MLQEAGLTPYQALRVATVNAARLLAAFDQLGTVEEGKTADLVLAATNPLANPRTLRTPAGVMVAGRWYDRIMLDKLKDRVQGADENER